MLDLKIWLYLFLPYYIGMIMAWAKRRKIYNLIK